MLDFKNEKKKFLSFIEFVKVTNYHMIVIGAYVLNE